MPQASSIKAFTDTHSGKEIIQDIIKIFRSLTFDEAYDLVEVETPNVKVSVKVR
jgi:hypothetical protein